MLYSGDDNFWDDYQPDFAGMKVSGIVEGRAGLHFADALAWLPTGDGNVFGNSGAQAIIYVAEWGANPIILTGFDMGGGHWHGPNISRNAPADTFEKWVVGMAAVSARMRADGVTVLNASRETAIPPTTFPRVTLDEALEWCKP